MASYKGTNHVNTLNSKTRNLTEGKVRKGGRNTLPSQITKRPAAPAPIVKNMKQSKDNAVS